MDDNVFFVDVFNKMLDANRFPNRYLFQPEGLHLNEKGYVLWKETINDFMTEHNISLR